MTLRDVYTTFWSHIDELRRTVLQMIAMIAFGTFVCFFCYKPLIDFLIIPLQSIEHQKLVTISPLEGVSSAIQVSVWVGAIATSPFWLFIAMQFIAPALRSREKRLILPFLITSCLLTTLGLGFAFFVTIPIANNYLFLFNESISMNLWSLKHYLDYTLFLLLANGIAFEFGAIGLFAVHLNVISTEMLIAKRRIAIVLAFILGALLTPPDIFTQVMLAIPLIGIYELTILYSRMRKQPISQNTHD